jgi:SAM-dependent methyltransferase
LTDKKPSASEFWDQSLWDGTVPRHYWTNNPLSNAYANFMMTDDFKYQNSIQWFGERYLSRFHKLPAAKGVSIGCGTGIAERQSLEAGLCHRMDGFDFSPASLEKARRRAQEAGLESRLRYELKDLNRERLPEESYEFALSFGCLHHIEKLEHLLSTIHDSLKRDGLFYFNEYVGPPRFQWPREIVDMINHLINLLPSRCLKTGHYRPIAEKDLADPSEAIRSDEIMAIGRQYFEFLDGRYYGGALLFPLWGEVIWPEIFLDPSLEEYQSILKLLLLLDEFWTRNLEGSFVQVVACRKDAPRDLIQEGLRIATNAPKHPIGEWLRAAPGKKGKEGKGGNILLSMGLEAANAFYKTMFVLKNQDLRTLGWKFKWFLRERIDKYRSKKR